MKWNNIQNGEKGLSVRSKINEAVQNLIGGSKGLLKVWESLAELLGIVEEHKEESDEKLEDLRKGVRKNYSYTDKQLALTRQAITKQITEVQNATLRNKGYFSTLAVLQQVWPSSEVGTIAFVGTEIPYAVYKWSDGGGWYDTGLTYSGEPANFEGYAKIGHLEGDDTQLIDYLGNPLFPITTTLGVRNAEGDTLERLLGEINTNITTLQQEKVFLTEAEYESLEEKDSTKLYFVFEEE